ncbi:hypothetical protein ASG67_18025 [Sphingomonas sp. Leaf339]|nr:hypothetical protein ASG67_18025 [Sphingomonas sp. Leaf339]
MSVLLAEYLSRSTAAQRLEMVTTMTEPKGLGTAINLTDDLDMADRIAALLIGHKEAVIRLLNSAISKLPKG